MQKTFEALGDIEDLEEEHDQILVTCRDAAKQVIGRSRKQSKPWIRDKTVEKVKERKEAKLKMESARSHRLKQKWKEEYNAEDKEMKQGAGEDNRSWSEEQAIATERLLKIGEARSQDDNWRMEKTGRRCVCCFTAMGQTPEG